MKKPKLTHWMFSNFKMYPLSNIFPADCQYSILKLHLITSHEHAFGPLENVSVVIANASNFLTQGSDQLPAFMELAEVVKRHDKTAQIDWVNTAKIVEWHLEKKQYTCAFIAATLDRLYATVGMPEAVK